MPTKDRPEWVRRSLACFLAQKDIAAELLVLDDGQAPVRHLMPDDPRVRYLHLPPTNLAAKRNLALDLAAAPLAAMWDDDDEWAPHRLAVQVEALRRNQDAECCLPRCLLTVDRRDGRSWLHTPERPDQLDNAVVMRVTERRLPLDGNPITALVYYLRDTPSVVIDGVGLGVAYLHGHNASCRRPEPPRYVES